jgi:membrane-associated phospholipid phosphatase
LLNQVIAMAFQWDDAVLFGVLAVLIWISETFQTYPERFFVERDPALSYPLVANVVSSKELVVMAMWTPAAILCILQWSGLFRSVAAKTSSFFSRIFLLQGPFWLAMALQYAVVAIMKKFVGRLRPNFFALCDYQGYRAAAAGDRLAMERYLSATQPGKLGDGTSCISDSRPHLSFPSAHASVAFSGLGFLALCLFSTAQRKGASRAVQTYVTVAPLAIATWIASTRVRSYWHNTDDVAVGALIGLVSAAWIFSSYVTPVKIPSSLVAPFAESSSSTCSTELPSDIECRTQNVEWQSAM